MATSTIKNINNTNYIYPTPANGLGGSVQLIKIGRIIIVGYSDLVVNATIQMDTVICTGLTNALDNSSTIYLASPTGFYRCMVNTSGNLIAKADIPSGYYIMGGSYVSNS